MNDRSSAPRDVLTRSRALRARRTAAEMPAPPEVGLALPTGPGAEELAAAVPPWMQGGAQPVADRAPDEGGPTVDGGAAAVTPGAAAPAGGPALTPGGAPGTDGPAVDGGEAAVTPVPAGLAMAGGGAPDAPNALVSPGDAPTVEGPVLADAPAAVTAGGPPAPAPVAPPAAVAPGAPGPAVTAAVVDAPPVASGAAATVQAGGSLAETVAGLRTALAAAVAAQRAAVVAAVAAAKGQVSSAAGTARADVRARFAAVRQSVSSDAEAARGRARAMIQQQQAALAAHAAAERARVQAAGQAAEAAVRARADEKANAAAAHGQTLSTGLTAAANTQVQAVTSAAQATAARYRGHDRANDVRAGCNTVVTEAGAAIRQAVQAPAAALLTDGTALAAKLREEGGQRATSVATATAESVAAFGEAEAGLAPALQQALTAALAAITEAEQATLARVAQSESTALGGVDQAESRQLNALDAAGARATAALETAAARGGSSLDGVPTDRPGTAAQREQLAARGSAMLGSFQVAGAGAVAQLAQAGSEAAAALAGMAQGLAGPLAQVLSGYAGALAQAESGMSAQVTAEVGKARQGLTDDANSRITKLTEAQTEALAGIDETARAGMEEMDAKSRRAQEGLARMVASARQELTSKADEIANASFFDRLVGAISSFVRGAWNALKDFLRDLAIIILVVLAIVAVIVAIAFLIGGLAAVAAVLAAIVAVVQALAVVAAILTVIGVAFAVVDLIDAWTDPTLSSDQRWERTGGAVTNILLEFIPDMGVAALLRADDAADVARGASRATDALRGVDNADDVVPGGLGRVVDEAAPGSAPRVEAPPRPVDGATPTDAPRAPDTARPQDAPANRTPEPQRPQDGSDTRTPDAQRPGQPQSGADLARQLGYPDAPAGYVWVRNARTGEPYIRRLPGRVEDGLPQLGFDRNAGTFFNRDVPGRKIPTADNARPNAAAKPNKPAAGKDDFVTHGLPINDPTSIREGRALLEALRRADPDAAEDVLRGRCLELLRSGKDRPRVETARADTELFKVVPTGGAPGARSPYWLTRAEIDALKADPGNLPERLALPPSSHAPSYDVHVIRPRDGLQPDIFRSEVAPADAGGRRLAGGGEQTLVPDRGQWTAPQATGERIVVQVQAHVTPPAAATPPVPSPASVTPAVPSPAAVTPTPAVPSPASVTPTPTPAGATPGGAAAPMNGRTLAHDGYKLTKGLIQSGISAYNGLGIGEQEGVIDRVPRIGARLVGAVDGTHTDPRSGTVHIEPGLRGPMREGAEAYEAANAARAARFMAVHQRVWSGQITDAQAFAAEMVALESAAARAEGVAGRLEVQGQSLQTYYADWFAEVQAGGVMAVPDGNVLNRVFGLLQATGGALEVALGGSLLLTPEPTMVTKVLGVGLAAHGMDDLQAGLRQAWTGESTRNLTAQGVSAVAETAGASPETAETIGDVTDLGLSVGLGLAGGAKALTKAPQIVDDVVEGGVKVADGAVTSVSDEVLTTTKAADEGVAVADDVGAGLSKLPKPAGDYTAEEIADYFLANGAPPPGFIRKAEATKLGWAQRQGNLSDVAPGHAIYDVFRNDPKGGERLLPHAQGRVWTEIDLHYTGGHRNSSRVLVSNDGLAYVTKDHYKTVEQIR